jgi:hypothetical protein
MTNPQEQMVAKHVAVCDYDAWGGEDPVCWNCEFVDMDFNKAPPNLPTHFCNPICSAEYWSKYPLRNFLFKRRKEWRKPA